MVDKDNNICPLECKSKLDPIMLRILDGTWIWSHCACCRGVAPILSNSTLHPLRPKKIDKKLKMSLLIRAVCVPYEGRSAFKILTGTPAGKRPLGRPRCRWEDNIKMDSK